VTVKWSTRLLTRAPYWQIFAQRNPRYLLRIVNRHEEFYALIMLYVEQHYLRTKGVSLTGAR